MSRSDAQQAAYEWGREIGPADIEYYSQSATYANTVLPKLREMAGFKDPMGVGTYTSAPDDEAAYRRDELIDAFIEGLTEGGDSP